MSHPVEPMSDDSWSLRLGRLLRTVSHLKPGQVFHRLRWKLRPYLSQKGGRYVDAGIVGELDRLEPPFAMSSGRVSESAKELLEGRFSLVGLPPVDFETIDWQCRPEGDLLWTFTLHYFEWGLELVKAWRASGEEAYATMVLDAIDDWIEDNPFGSEPGWHSYPMSRRLVAWSKILVGTQGVEGWEGTARRAVQSMAEQASQLVDWPEYHLEGNHLLANFHALAWMERQFGELFGTELRGRLDGFADRFEGELLRQTRADGTHEENATSYHLLVLKDAFEWMLLSDRCDRPVSSTVRERIEQMFDFLAGILKPDCSVPMLNDSVGGYPMAADELLAAGAVAFERGDWKYVAGEVEGTYLRWLLGEAGQQLRASLEPRPPEERSRAFDESGYYVLRSGWASDADYLLFDCGPVGPDHQPGHAHADTLNVIVSVGGEPLLVDPAVSTYRAGPEREAERSTAAHNTVEVDGVDSSEMWAEFRVGRRARARLEEWEPSGRVAGRHDGYRHLDDGVVHSRRVTYREPGHWRIADLLESGGGGHTYCARFQLAVGVQVEEVGEEAVKVMTAGGRRVRFSFDSSEAMTLEVEKGRVARTWRRREPAPRISVVVRATEESTTIDTEIAVEQSEGT